MALWKEDLVIFHRLRRDNLVKNLVNDNSCLPVGSAGRHCQSRWAGTEVGAADLGPAAPQSRTSQGTSATPKM